MKTIVVLTALLLPPLAALDADQANDILQATGVKGGLVVHVGCGDGKLTAALRVSESYIVQGLDRDAKHVETARQYIQAIGLSGRVSIQTWSGSGLPYIDNLVNLLVAENPGDLSAREIQRVLAPLGVAYVKTGGQWTKTVKPWPKGIDEWTHYLHDASGNAVAEDTQVGPPRHIQWWAGPKRSRQHDSLASMSAMVSAGGRVFHSGRRANRVDALSVAMEADRPGRVQRHGALETRHQRVGQPVLLFSLRAKLAAATPGRHG